MRRAEGSLRCQFSPSTVFAAGCSPLPDMATYSSLAVLWALVSASHIGVTPPGFILVQRLWPEILLLAWQGLYLLSQLLSTVYSFPWLLWPFTWTAQSRQSPMLPVQNHQRMVFGGIIMSSCTWSLEPAWQVKVTASVREFPSVDTHILQPTTPKLKCIFNKLTLCNKAI